MADLYWKKQYGALYHFEVILTSFFPALTVLVLCKVSKVGWNNLVILPNIRKAWKVYLFAVLGALVMNYLNELFYVSDVHEGGILSDRGIYPA